MDMNTYNATIKMFGSEPTPAFESLERLTTLWGRNWGCDNDVGQIRAVLLHRPGNEFNVIDPKKRIEAIGSYGDLQAGWYWQSKRIPPLAELQAQHDAMAAILKAEGAEVIYLDGVEDGRFKSVYTRDSSFAVKGGAIVCRMAPRMRHGEELPVTRKLAQLGMPILRTLHGTAMMEGGTFAWLNSKNAVIGRSIRANDEGIEQIRDVLKYQGVELHVVDLNGKVKFPFGSVRYCGDRDGAIAYLAANGADTTKLPCHKQIVGKGETAIVGYMATVTGGYGATVTGGDEATVTGGYGAIIEVKHYDFNAGRFRKVVGYIGENGLLPNVKYKLNDKHLFVPVDLPESALSTASPVVTTDASPVVSGFAAYANLSL